LAARRKKVRERGGGRNIGVDAPCINTHEAYSGTKVFGVGCTISPLGSMGKKRKGQERLEKLSEGGTNVLDKELQGGGTKRW